MKTRGYEIVMHGYKMITRGHKTVNAWPQDNDTMLKDNLWAQDNVTTRQLIRARKIVIVLPQYNVATRQLMWGHKIMTQCYKIICGHKITHDYETVNTCP